MFYYKEEISLKVGIMQPYLFPYLGYWQLIKAVDQFVILDDVNYIKQGFINRNSILVNNQIYTFTIPLDRPSPNKLINETKLSFSEKKREKFLRTIYMAYKKAPFFEYVYPLIEKLVLFEEEDLTVYIKNSIEQIKEYIGLPAKVLVSSEMKKDNTLKSEARIIEINKRLRSTLYINAIGGQNLYSRIHFAESGIELKFIKMQYVEYPQFKNEFVPNLSIIDVLMFNSIDRIWELLDKYILI